MITTVDVETSWQKTENGGYDPSPFHPDNILVSVGINDEYYFTNHSERVDEGCYHKIQSILDKTTLLIGHNIKFDLIVLNPPYIKTSDIYILEKDVRIYDPYLALNGGPNGLHAYEIISNQAQFYLNDRGVIIMEIGFGQLDSVKKIFRMKGFTTILEEKDLQGINRVVGFKFKK